MPIKAKKRAAQAALFGACRRTSSAPSPKGETYIQAGRVLPASEALDAPWPKESTHKFSLLHDNRAARDFDGGTFRVATVDEWPISKSMSGGVMIIKPGAMRNLHWNVNANEWQYYDCLPP